MASRTGERPFVTAIRCASVALALSGFAACSGNPEIIREVFESPGGKDGGLSDGMAPLFTTDTGVAGCKSKTCADVGADCGDTLNGCNGILHCGTCSKGEDCSIVTPNVCTKLTDLCQGLSKRDACSGKACGVESDGCGTPYAC